MRSLGAEATEFPMPAPRSLNLTTTAATLALALGIARGAEVDLSEALHKNSHEIRLQGGELTGDGRSYLVKVTHGAQFVALGEEHNNIDIPPFTVALFRLLHQSEGFQYLALEQDPVMMQRVSEPPVRGDRAAITALAVRYLFGFTFDSDQELTMLAQVGALASGKGRPIWGCDQAFGVTHILDELLAYATDRNRAELETLRSQAAQVEATRDLRKNTFMQSEVVMAAIPSLRAAFPDARSQRGTDLVETIAKSSEIYSYYMAGERGEVPGYYSNNAVREDYMKGRFLAEYHFAEQRDGKPPKVLLKFGQYHLYRGLSPTHVPSLGNFVSDFARSKENGFLSIYIIPLGAADAPGGTGYLPFAGNERSKFLKPFAPLADSSRWVLLDLRPFREGPYYRALGDAAPDLTDDQRQDLRRVVYGYDALLLIGRSSPATHEATHVTY
jgi:hypothetical protein